MSENSEDELNGLPGSELVSRGLADLEHGILSESALLILIAEPRLTALGIPVKPGNLRVPQPVEHALYSLLEQRLGIDAYSFYNSLIRRIVSFTRALEREKSRAVPPA
jgi:hypothetical protein